MSSMLNWPALAASSARGSKGLSGPLAGCGAAHSGNAVAGPRYLYHSAAGGGIGEKEPE